MDHAEALETSEAKLMMLHEIMWETDAYIMGGKLEDIPRPHIRKWPTSKQRRIVDVRFADYKWRGYQHIYVDIVEEFNYLWDMQTNWPHNGKGCWREAFDDFDGQGRTFHKRFNQRLEAEAYAREVCIENFSSETHEILRNCSPVETDFYYRREGD